MNDSNKLETAILLATAVRAAEVVPAAIALTERRTDHKYVTHCTYTGPGCAICGRQEGEHGPAETMLKETEKCLEANPGTMVG